MTDPDPLLDEREAHARRILRDLGGVLIALSGGVDSSVLAALAAQELGDRAVAATAVSEVYPRRETQAATDLARRLGLRHLFVNLRHLADVPGFAHNPLDRCYRCKKVVFGRLREIALREGLALVHGEQVDDLTDDRPGRRAAQELGVRAPLAEAGLTKQQVRALAARLDLPVADAPSMACLATRFPHGTRLTPEDLARAEAAEEVLSHLGLSNYRARCHGDLVRLQVPPDEIATLVQDDVRTALIEQLRGLGFRYLTLDLEGYS